MRTETGNHSVAEGLSPRKKKVVTNYLNKTISLELKDLGGFHVLLCSFANGSTKNARAIIQKAEYGYEFTDVEHFDYPCLANFQFTESFDHERPVKYRLLIHTEGGVTYFSEIVTCDN